MDENKLENGESKEDEWHILRAIICDSFVILIYSYVIWKWRLPSATPDEHTVAFFFYLIRAGYMFFAFWRYSVYIGVKIQDALDERKKKK